MLIKLEKGFPLGELKPIDQISTQINGIPMDNEVRHQRHGKPQQRLQSHLKIKF